MNFSCNSISVINWFGLLTMQNYDCVTNRECECECKMFFEQILISFALLNIDFAWHFVDNAIEKVLALKLHIKVARWFSFDAYFSILENVKVY